MPVSSWNPTTLKVMVSLMLAQAQECHWKQHLLTTMERSVFCAFLEGVSVVNVHLS